MYGTKHQSTNFRLQISQFRCSKVTHHLCRKVPRLHCGIGLPNLISPLMLVTPIDRLVSIFLISSHFVIRGKYHLPHPNWLHFHQQHYPRGNHIRSSSLPRYSGCILARVAYNYSHISSLFHHLLIHISFHFPVYLLLPQLIPTLYLSPTPVLVEANDFYGNQACS